MIFDFEIDGTTQNLASSPCTFWTNSSARRRCTAENRMPAVCGAGTGWSSTLGPTYNQFSVGVWIIANFLILMKFGVKTGSKGNTTKLRMGPKYRPYILRNFKNMYIQICMVGDCFYLLSFATVISQQQKEIHCLQPDKDFPKCRQDLHISKSVPKARKFTAQF